MMNRKIVTIVTLSLMIGSMVFSAGCGKASEINELENHILEIESEIIEKERELEDWEDIYNEAYNAYYAPHSDSMEIQQELQRTKEYMDKAFKEVNSIKREISLLELDKEMSEDQLESLKN